MVVVMLGVMLYAVYLRTGRVPWQDLGAFKKPNISVPKKLSLPGKKAKKELVYKWQDADGVWQYSQEPPPERESYSQIEVDPNANVVAAVPTPEQAEETESIEGNESEKNDKDDTLFPYTPERIEKLMDDARDVQNKLNERAGKQQEILDGL